MIGAAAFIIFFVVVGLGVVLISFGGGSPRGARRQLHRQSRFARRVTTLFVTVIVVAFGVAIPVLAIAANDHDQSNHGPGGLDLTASQKQGRALFATNCSTCHTLNAANATGRVGPNLDQLRPPKALVVNAVEMGRARGNGQMPANLLSGQDVNRVADFVGASAGR